MFVLPALKLRPPKSHSSRGITRWKVTEEKGESEAEHTGTGTASTQHTIACTMHVEALATGRKKKTIG
jgi:hypothetical protein